MRLIRGHAASGGQRSQVTVVLASAWALCALPATPALITGTTEMSVESMIESLLFLT